MKRKAGAEASTTGDLTRLVRQTRLLDPIAKRHWLKLLPYLTPTDRARLEEILRAETNSPNP